MKVVNFDTIPIDTTAGGTILLTSAQATAGIQEGMAFVTVNPSVDLVIISGQGAYPNIPGSVVGTAANSPLVCPAGAATTFPHNSGQVRAISSAGTSTVKFSLGCNP